MSEFTFEKNEILTNLTLLEDHAQKFPCEYCMEKHISKIIGYSEEIVLGGENGVYKKLGEQARRWRREIQGAKEHTHVLHNPRPKRLYAPYGLTTKEAAAKRRVKGRCTRRSRNLYCRLVRCIKYTEPKEKAGEIKSAVAVCHAKVK